MTLNNISTYSDISSEIKSRMKIGVFMVLLFQFTSEIYPDSQNALLFYSFYALLEISSMVIVYRFAGNSAVGKDINELNLYALFLHVIRIPIYFLTEIPMGIFKYFIWTLFILAILRLFYFKKLTNGEYQRVKLFSILEYIQGKLIAQKNKFKNWTELLFFGSAIPLWFIIYQTNNASITITVIGLMLFIYLISDAMKAQVATAPKEPELDAKTEQLCKLFRARSEEEQAAIIELVSTTFTLKNNPVTRHIKKTQDAEKARLTKYAERHYYLLARLMQLLPGDITNQPELTQEQIDMCLAVSTLAEKGVIVIEEGLELIDNLLFMAMHSKEKKSLSNVDSFIAYLEEGAEFMRESANDYGGAANYIKKKELPKSRK